MRLELAKLRSAMEILFDHLEEEGYDSADISSDFYWHVETAELYDPYNEPRELTLGQLSFDWTRLEELLRRETDPLGLDFVWLSALLRALGEQIPL